MTTDSYPDSYADYLIAVEKKEEVMKILNELTYGQAVRTLYLCSHAIKTQEEKNRKEGKPRYHSPIVECLKDKNDHLIRELMQNAKIEEPDKLLEQLRDDKRSAKEGMKRLEKGLKETKRESRQSFWISLFTLVFVISWAMIRIL